MSTTYLAHTTKSERASGASFDHLSLAVFRNNDYINAVQKKSNSLAQAAGISHQSNFCLATPEEIQWDFQDTMDVFKNACLTAGNIVNKQMILYAQMSCF